MIEGVAEMLPADLVRDAGRAVLKAAATGSEPYSDVNAVIALMLTTSVLSQAQASGW